VDLTDSLSTREVARLCGWRTTERVRQLLKSGELEGGQTDTKRWQITRESVARLQAKRGGVNARASDASDFTSLATDIERLSTAIRRLEERDPSAAPLLDAMTRERDRYRAETLALRGATLEMRASTAPLIEAVKQLILVIEARDNALGQLLGPSSLEDLPRG
jgi:hypothetical protein